MAVAYQNSGTDTITAATSRTIAADVGSGSNRILLVHTGGASNASAGLVTGVTYAGVAMTQIYALSHNAFSSTSWWYLVAPATGSNNIIVSCDTHDILKTEWAAYNGVHQTTPFVSQGGPIFLSAEGTNGTLTVGGITADTDELIVDAASQATSFGLAENGAQTNRGENSSPDQGISEKLGAGGSSNSMTWTTNSGGTGAWHHGVAVLAPAATVPNTAQVTFRLFASGDELPHYDTGTTPVIESGDITHTNDTDADNSKALSYPAYGDGALVIFGIFTDAAVTHTLPASGPNSETIVTLYEDQTPGAGGPTASAFYYVATAAQGSPGTLTVTLSASETASGECIVVPAGEFDSTTPIGNKSVGFQVSGTGATVDTTAFNALRSGSRVLAVGGVDADPMDNPFSPSGWTDRAGAGRDDGAQNSFVATLDAGTTAGASVASAAFGINTGDTGAVFAIEVCAPRTADGRTPLAANGADATLDVDTDYGISFRLENSGTVETPTAYKLQYNHESGGWNDVTTSSDVVIAVATADYADGDDVPEYIGGSGTFVSNNNGACDNDATFTLAAGLGENEAIECHFTFQIVGADVADEDTIQLRIVESDATVLDAYTDTPTITVNDEGGAGEETASGTPAAQASTVAGTAERVVTSSGAPASQSASVAGTGAIEGSHTSSGTPAAQSATVAGTAERELRETGSPVEIIAQSATVAGTAAVGGEVTGSGAPAAQSATTAGTAERSVTGSGSPAAQSSTVAGTAERSVTSSGTPAAQSATVEGAGQVGSEIVASGTPAAQSATVAGTAERTLTGSGTPAAQSASAAGAAERVVTSSGAPAAQSATTAGSGTVGDIIAGSGTPAAQAASVAGTAERTLTSSGAPTSQAATVAGSGDVTSELIASGALAAQHATVTGVALRVITGSGAPAAQAAEVEGYDVLYPIKGRRAIGSVGGKRGQGQVGGKRAIGQN